MSAYARGRDVSIRLMKDGALQWVWNPDSASFSVDETLERDERLGEKESRNTKTIDGSSGSVTFKDEDGTLTDLQLAEAEAYLDGAQIVKYSILRTVYYPKNGQSKTLLYPDVVFNWSDDAGGKNDPLTTTIDWQGGIPREV